ncbi:hypothetical protein [Paraburkholderia sp. GAS32]|uniref:hypothetical protein n=1 Tax=Paraburkholderia sp. GAS32 TaxID=3035129 RepID=UPI003D218948
MKKKVLLVALTLACTSAFAGTASEQAASAPKELSNAEVTQIAQLVQINNTLLQLLSAEKASAAAPDDSRFCYQDGKSFSEGAVRDGLTCYRDGVRVTIAGKTPTIDPLRWAKVKQDRISMKAD